MSEEQEPKRPSIAAVHSLDDARKKSEEEHINFIKDLFEKDPQLLNNAIIISDSTEHGGVIMPPHLNEREIVGMLEMAKFDVMWPDDEEDDDDEDDEED